MSTADKRNLDDDFQLAADDRWAKLLETGKTVAWDDFRAWLEARARGEKTNRPKARKLGH